MPKSLQTQWDFGKPAASSSSPERRVFSVAEITGQVRVALEKEIGHAWVTGEISNLRVQSSGHVYFTLKDQYAQLACVLFKADARSFNRSLLKDGEIIVVHGEMTVYEPRGQYQLRIIAVELQGQGKLQAAFEALKQKLQTEGLFGQSRKRPIPKFVARVGLVTSPDGAALHDVLHVIERRQPSLKIFFVPCRVQGPDASREIALGLRLLNDWSRSAPERKLDLILLTRGGGSLEDLWAFNEELTARAVASSHVPTISAVGHEIDFSISDFVADARAATPSAAAEMITEGAVSARQIVAENQARLRRLLSQKLASDLEILSAYRRVLERRSPLRWLRDQQQLVDEQRAAMDRCVKTALRTARQTVTEAKSKLQIRRLVDRLKFEKSGLHRLQNTLSHRAGLSLKVRAQAISALQSQLRLLGPQQTLNRGYSITSDAATGAIVRQASQIKTGAKLKTRLGAGEIESIAQ